jgi:antitoxin component YwqK of YwqJK toxin-antitoxin module
MFRALFFLMILSGSTGLQGQNRLDEQGRKTGHWKVEHPNGKTEYEGEFLEGRPVGEMLRYHENGSLRARMIFDPDGRRSYVYLFYSNGKAAAEGPYVDQLKDSVWTYYSEFDGSVRVRESYSMGKLHGTSRSYYPDGNISEEVEWKENVKHGAWKQYYNDGTIRLSGQYEQGLLQGNYEVFYSNGKIEIRGNYLDNDSHGIWRFFDEDGKEVYAMEYVHGSPADMEKYEMWIQDSLLKKYNAPAEPEFFQ